MQMFSARRFVCAFLLILGFALAPEARAHARLVRSEPAGGAAVSATPPRLDLWFNELLDVGFNTVSVVLAGEPASKTRHDYAKEKPVVDPRDRTHLTVKLEALPPGEYIVEWRVLSRDGHTAPGRLTFRVTAR